MDSKIQLTLKVNAGPFMMAMRDIDIRVRLSLLKIYMEAFIDAKVLAALGQPTELPTFDEWLTKLHTRPIRMSFI
jgi:hypothetical protein